MIRKSNDSNYSYANEDEENTNNNNTFIEIICQKKWKWITSTKNKLLKLVNEYDKFRKYHLVKNDLSNDIINDYCINLTSFIDPKILFLKSKHWQYCQIKI